MSQPNVSIHIEKAIIRVTPDLIPGKLLKASFVDLSATTEIRGESSERYTAALDGAAVMDHSTGLMWAADVSDELNWDDAYTYCRNFRLGGFTDWRMGLLSERTAITDYDRHAPALHPLFRDASDYEWTAKQTHWTEGKTGSSRSFWCVNAYYGSVGSGSASGRFRARPVRVAAPAGQ